LQLDRLVGQPERRDVLLVDQELVSSRIVSTISGDMIVTSGGRAKGRFFQNFSAASASWISGRREPPPHR
jgi:hypothetical protein